MTADAAVYDGGRSSNEFIGEDDLRAFEGWLKYQAIDVAALTKEELTLVREEFDAATKRRDTARKVGRMKLKMMLASIDTPLLSGKVMISG